MRRMSVEHLVPGTWLGHAERMKGAPSTQSAGGQLAFLDHVMIVTDLETATATANSPELRDLGRFDVGTVESDGRTWTGRYLFGRRTYVELFGPDDLEDSEKCAAGLGLSTRTPGAIATLVERAANAGSGLVTGQRSVTEGGQTLPWFEYAEPEAAAKHLEPSFEIWVMEF